MEEETEDPESKLNEKKFRKHVRRTLIIINERNSHDLLWKIYKR